MATLVQYEYELCHMIILIAKTRDRLKHNQHDLCEKRQFHVVFKEEVTQTQRVAFC